MQYVIAEDQACEKLTIYKIQPHAQTYQGTWYLNTNVPEEKRRAMNQEIALLRMDGKVQKLLGSLLQEIVPKTCGLQNQPKIDERVLVPLLVVLLGPLAFVMFIVLLIVCLAKRRLKRLLLRRGEHKRNDESHFND